MNTSKLSLKSKILVAFGGLMLALALFFPLWRIDFEAPQYPEGLRMFIYPHKMGGDVQIINGLNHYIGMKTIHDDSFVELKILPYLIGGFSVFFFLTAFLGGKKALYTLTLVFILFGIASMIDFWHWEYQYGHELDPNAAIKVPGATYQPPLIGYKLLLNFGVLSLPDVGGIMLVIAGLVLVIAIMLENNLLNRFMGKKMMLILPFSAMFFLACVSSGPESITLNKDNCAYCKMTISDGRFGCEIITEKGRTYKFDDIECMFAYLKQNQSTPIQSHWVHNYLDKSNLIPAEKSYYVTTTTKAISSPMGGNTAAFKNKSDAESAASKYNTQVQTWEQIAASKK
ncbi:MAG: nitrous oxide reductase accessory protein NosL [Bacteroidia bacterium]|nr:nitrous oxide reductase accessory protein NosL [Bacteroidia bacterium]